MSYMKEIHSYGADLAFMEKSSPFELIGALVKRDKLEEVRDTLTSEELQQLEEYDKTLLANANIFYELIKEVYQFQNRKPLKYWWSNIDLIVSGKLTVDLSPSGFEPKLHMA